MTERVLPYEDALLAVLEEGSGLPAPGERETLPLLGARGRVLAQPVVAERDQPPFARSTRDGFAVRHKDLARAVGPLRVVGSVRAGEGWTGPALEAGEAIEILTGAPLPAGADAVLMVEHTEPVEPGAVRPLVDRTLTDGENVVPAGAEAVAGAELVPAGRLVDVPVISLASSCGYSSLEVFAQPRVAIVATGDELVELDVMPAAWQIRNSNSYSLAALVEAEGAQALRLPAAQDTRDSLRDRMAASAGSQLVLFSGGVSMGKYDLVEEVLREAGAEFFFTGARIQPGRPVVFGRMPARTAPATAAGGWTYFFGLPGNPISTEVCFRLFVSPLLRALCGRGDREPRFADAQLAEGVRGGAKVLRFLPALVESDWQRVTVRPVPWQGSGDLAANARANGLRGAAGRGPPLPRRGDGAGAVAVSSA